VGQQERGEVVGRQRRLNPVGRLPAPGELPAGVVDQDVQPVVLLQELAREPPYLGLREQVRQHQLDARIATVRLDVFDGGLPPTLVAADHDHRRSHPRQAGGGGFADPAGAPRDYHDLAAHAAVSVFHASPVVVALRHQDPRSCFGIPATCSPKNASIRRQESSEAAGSWFRPRSLKNECLAPG